jgi:UDP-2,4-diacetamido-2,4,6-trideoxy-beta-L-altropyranose hydrolase
MTSCSVQRVIFRADASRQIGTGHVTRCLTLAQNLLRHRVESVFICRTANGHLIDDIQASGFKVFTISSDVTESAECGLLSDGWQTDAQECLNTLSAYGQADWLIVDHYSLDARWERMIRPLAKRIMVIDDLANRPHDCDYLLDQTYGEDGSRYQGLLPTDCRTLLGAHYVLLRPEFSIIRGRFASQILPVDPKIVHVFFGGTDVNANTLRFATLLLANFLDIQLKVVVGRGSTFEPELRKLADRYEPRLSWEKGIATMAECMSSCDVAIGAPGMATWERACLGLPAAYIAVSENQVPVLEELAMRGLCLFFGVDHAITDGYFTNAFESFLGDHARLVAMRERGMSAIDGLGGERVAAALSTVPL